MGIDVGVGLDWRAAKTHLWSGGLGQGTAKEEGGKGRAVDV